MLPSHRARAALAASPDRPRRRAARRCRSRRRRRRSSPAARRRARRRSPTRPTTAAASATSCRPGTRGRYNAAELAAFLATGATVPHCCDQLGMYRDLVYATPGLTGAADPRATSRTRASACPTDRPSGPTPRARTSRSCATTASACRTSTARRATARCSASATSAPRTGCSSWTCCATPGRGRAVELRGRLERRDGRRAVGGRAVHRGRPRAPGRRSCRTSSAPQGEQIQRDVDNYIAGINAVHRRGAARPDEAARRVRRDRAPAGPGAVGSRADLIATASLVGGIFGKGGGEELEWSQVADALEKRFGKRKRRARVPRLPRRRGPGGAGDGAAASASPTRRAPKQPRGGRAARPRLADATHEVVATPARRAAGLALSRAALPADARRTRCWSPAASPRAGTR